MRIVPKIAGYDIERVEAWIESHVANLKPPYTWIPIEGGNSNLTCMITDECGCRVVVRRPPLGQLLPKAHDMSREWRIISALASTQVPVPVPLCFCEDVSVTGAPFYVMSHVAGHALRWDKDTTRFVPEDSRRKLAYTFIDVLVDLHAVIPEKVGLSDLGRPENYIGRQIATWYKSWMASIAPANYDDTRAHELQRFMLENIPDQGPATIVHGDYGLHNCLTRGDGTIGAVVDWEISTLGDPLADVAYTLIQFSDPKDDNPPASGMVTSVPGFPSRSELASRYGARAGRDIKNLDFYYGFNLWKTAAIAHGVYARYMEGKKSAEGVDLEEMRASIDRQLAAAETMLARWKR